jgi:ArsR family transcriptional regulator, arsenate/arsenite/antimonite-responsive transcriptional repressor / arsenate reductase (thioredoxin)
VFDYSRNMEAKAAAQGFAALSQETRLGLMRLLATRGPSGMSAGDLAAAMQQAPSTLSFHLAALEQAGLVRSTRQGRHVIYAVRFAGLRSLFGFLTETCCNGRPELCGDLARLLPDDVEEVGAMTPAFNVLFLCTHNSARSIIAESILTQIAKGKFNAYSAGSDPAATPMPEVLERLKSFGHDVSHLRSKSWNDFTGPNAPRMDFVITLCDTLHGQTCPDFGNKVVTAAWPFPDPAKFSGSEMERITMFNQLYGMIRRRLEIFINLPYASLDQMALKARLDELGDSTKYSA